MWPTRRLPQSRGQLHPASGELSPETVCLTYRRSSFHFSLSRSALKVRKRRDTKYRNSAAEFSRRKISETMPEHIAYYSKAYKHVHVIYYTQFLLTLQVFFVILSKKVPQNFISRQNNKYFYYFIIDFV